MAIEVHTEVVRDPVEIVFEDGTRWATEREITRIEDWRVIDGVGRVNFGRVYIGPLRQVAGASVRGS